MRRACQMYSVSQLIRVVWGLDCEDTKVTIFREGKTRKVTAVWLQYHVQKRARLFLLLADLSFLFSPASPPLKPLSASPPILTRRKKKEYRAREETDRKLGLVHCSSPYLFSSKNQTVLSLSFCSPLVMTAYPECSLRPWTSSKVTILWRSRRGLYTTVKKKVIQKFLMLVCGRGVAWANNLEKRHNPKSAKD